MELKNKLEIVKNNISLAQKRAGLYNDIEIVAVTKTHSFNIIKKAYDVGFFSIGENKVQEALNKFESFKEMPLIKKRFIGHLQSNKLKKCLDIFDTIDSVDSLKLVKKISRAGESLGKKIPILLEINTSKEEQKYGFLPTKTEALLPCFEEIGVEIKGLMTVGPLTQEKKEIRSSFSRLREFKDKLNSEINHKKMKTLSMGMSNDYEIAIEEGSTMIRLGTYLFGKRGLL